MPRPKKTLAVALLAWTLAAVTATPPPTARRQGLQSADVWWQTGIIYQVYPISFQDSDGDGQGDLKGITDRLPYLQELGVTAVWLSPIYESPDVDMGYDISDFTEVDEKYGTMEDFESMVEEAHKLGMKVVLDFVPNHSSDEHVWFKEALKGPVDESGADNKYYDYYVWREGNEEDPPNDWQSVFLGSAWENLDGLGYYLHQFHKAQPDLNFRNPAVKEEIEEVIRFWLRKGVDGFRVDAIPHLFEDAEFRDNPGGIDDNQYMVHQEETFETIKEWRKLVDEIQEEEGKDLVLMMEAYADVETTMKYFGTQDEPAGHFPFNFFFINDIKGGASAKDVEKTILDWLNNRPDFGWNNWVVGNHDTHRVGSRMGKDLIDAMNALVLLLPGTAITYNGEEIGMVNGEFGMEHCKDLKACPEGETEEYYQENSRDFERTPFQWDTSEHAGFSTSEPWLPVNDDYLEVNAEVQSKDSKSHLSLYKKMAYLRKQSSGISLDIDLKVLNDNILSFLRSDDELAYMVLINFGDNEVTVDLTSYFGDLPTLKEYVSYKFNAEALKLESFKMESHSTVVLVSDHFEYDDGNSCEGEGCESTPGPTTTEACDEENDDCGSGERLNVSLVLLLALVSLQAVRQL